MKIKKSISKCVIKQKKLMVKLQGEKESAERTLRDEVEGLKRKIEKLERQIATLKEQIEASTRNVTSIESELRVASDEGDRNSSEIERLQQELDAANNSLSQLRDAYSKLQTEKERGEKILSEQVEAKINEVNQLNSKLKSVEGERDKSLARTASLYGQVTEIQEK